MAPNPTWWTPKHSITVSYTADPHTLHDSKWLYGFFMLCLTVHSWPDSSASSLQFRRMKILLIFKATKCNKFIISLNKTNRATAITPRQGVEASTSYANRMIIKSAAVPVLPLGLICLTLFVWHRLRHFRNWRPSNKPKKLAWNRHLNIS